MNINYKSVCCTENTTIIDNGTFPIEKSSATHSYIINNHELFYLKYKPDSGKNILVSKEFVDYLLIHMRKTFTNNYIKTKQELNQARNKLN